MVALGLGIGFLAFSCPRRFGGGLLAPSAWGNTSAFCLSLIGRTSITISSAADIFLRLMCEPINTKSTSKCAAKTNRRALDFRSACPSARCIPQPCEVMPLRQSRRLRFSSPIGGYQQHITMRKPVVGRTTGGRALPGHAVTRSALLSVGRVELRLSQPQRAKVRPVSITSHSSWVCAFQRTRGRLP